MKKRELRNLGIPDGEAMLKAFEVIRHLAGQKLSRNDMRTALEAVVDAAGDYAEDPVFGPLATELIADATVRVSYRERDEPAPYQSWGEDFDATSIRQMENACRLPVAVAGALMPDAHTGYGLPIGGVLATENAVIPYAVGMDIACRMKMTVLDLPVSAIRGQEGHLRNVLADETRFGMGSGFKRRREHAVMEADWSVSPVTQRNRDKAWKQLGSSGSGNTPQPSVSGVGAAARALLVSRTIRQSIHSRHKATQ